MARKFEDYSKENQETLKKTWNKKEIEAYIKLDNGLRKNRIYKLKEYYIQQSFGFGIGYDGNKFQLTNHTPFTFLTEFNILPSEAIWHKNQKQNKVHIF